MLGHGNLTNTDSYILSLYFAVVTMTTTGYGDVGAHYTGGFAGTIIVIIMGMVIFAYALSVLAATLANRDAPKYDKLEDDIALDKSYLR